MITDSVIGKRIVWNNKFGTVKFVGEVPPHRGIYYGIDWDNPSDGKHDGTFNGMKYFDSRYPTSGSFIKENIACFGVKFVDAVYDRYQQTDVAHINQHCFPSFEIIGWDTYKRKQGPIHKIKIMDIHQNYVSSPGEFGEIEKVCPCIEDLNLSSNLMTNWEQISLIGKQLKYLKHLKMNNTRLKIPENPERFKHDFPELTELVLCKCSLQWDDLVKAAVMWPELQCLKVAFNPISRLDTPPDCFRHVCLLDLSTCNITDWSEINKLAHLEKLILLNISGNGISEINIPPDEDLFPSLTTLFIADCNVNNWNSVNSLNNLSSLRILKLVRNPVLKNLESWANKIRIIARIAKLECLNGGEIKPAERSLAEYEYLKSLAKEWANCANNPAKQEQFLRDNPRYTELIKIHGEPEVIQPLDVSLKANLISVTVKLISENDDDVIKQSYTKKFSVSLLVYKLINIIKRLFNIDSNRPKVIGISSANPDMRIELDNDLKPLGAYGLSNGDTLLVMR